MPDRQPEGLNPMPIIPNDTPARPLAPCTLIQDCNHILTYAMRLDDGSWVCVHRTHGPGYQPITLDPIAHN